MERDKYSMGKQTRRKTVSVVLGGILAISLSMSLMMPAVTTQAAGSAGVFEASWVAAVAGVVDATVVTDASGAADSTGATTPTGIPLSELESRVDELVARYMHKYTPGLAIAVVKDGEVVFLRGYGYADIERQIPACPQSSVFEYGSIGKAFVYVSVMQLVEQGLLDIDEDIHIYLPEDFSRLLNFEKGFTMRDLLNHSAGFGEFFLNNFHDAEKVEREVTMREALLASQPRQIFEPGTASSYSNFGAALAAYVVGNISGQEFAAYERANILDPIGMSGTKNQPDWFNNYQFIQSKARGYMTDGRGGFVMVPWWYIGAYPAGSLRGTAEDLAQFAIALTPQQNESSPLFSSRNTLDLMLSPSFSDPEVMRGTHHGFMSYDGILPAIGHSGGTQGFNTDFVIVPSERFGVILLSNAAGGMEMNGKVLDLLIGNSMDAVVSPGDSLPDASSVAGNYTMLRRHDGNILEPLNFLFGTNIAVEAINENMISLSAMGGTMTYLQVRPYVFRLVSTDLALSRVNYELSFRMENGNPVGISMSGPFDATIQTFRQSPSLLIPGVIIVAISAIFFIIMPIAVLISFLRKKDKRLPAFNYLSSGLILSGTLLLLNNTLLLLRMVAVIPFVETSLITPHIWANCILVALAALLLIGSLVFIKRDKTTPKRKVLYFSTVTLVILFSLVLWNWNFFAIV